MLMPILVNTRSAYSGLIHVRLFSKQNNHTADHVASYATGLSKNNYMSISSHQFNWLG